MVLRSSNKKTPVKLWCSFGWTFARIATFSGTEPEATPAYFQNAQKDLDWKMDIATPEQEEKIMAYVEEGLNAGCPGNRNQCRICSRLRTKRILRLAKMAANYDVATFTHVRYASNMEPKSSYEAIKELIANSALTGAHMHICHINSTSLKDIEAIVPLIDDAYEQNI